MGTGALAALHSVGIIMAYENVVRDVLRRLNGISSLSSLHLTSVAKAIEQKAGEIIKIVFRPVARERMGRFPTVLLTQRLGVTGAGAPEGFFVYEHFIYYPKEAPEQLRRTRFSIAHELGHILMHAPYLPTYAGQRVYRRVPRTKRDMYSVKYAEDAEVEADLFAAILCQQYPPPRRPSAFHEPCRRHILDLEAQQMFVSRLPHIMSAVPTCRVLRCRGKCSTPN